jgi:hypothetical protein
MEDHLFHWSSVLLIALIDWFPPVDDGMYYRIYYSLFDNLEKQIKKSRISELFIIIIFYQSSFVLQVI